MLSEKVKSVAKLDGGWILRYASVGLVTALSAIVWCGGMCFLVTQTDIFDAPLVEEDNTLYLKGEDDNV